MKEIIIAPSILSADFADLKNEIKKVEQAGAKWLHIDVMDGKFVSNITIGIPVVKSLRKVSDMVYDVHLMIDEPIKYVNDFANAGADVITFHIEACTDPLKTIETIKTTGAKVGVSIKPNTPVSAIGELLDKVDLVLVMTVEPGFGGQTFMEDCVEKIRELRKIADEKGFDYHIEVDGGINAETAKIVVEAGADVLVAGSYVYSAADTEQAFRSLKNG